MLSALLSLCAGSAQEAVITLAGGSGTNGFADGLAAQALFNDPAGLGFDTNGNLYIADNQNHIIRKLAPDGVVSTVAGFAGTSGSANGSGPDARFDSPTGIAVAPDGTLYITDTGNHTIRRITAAGSVSTFAGLAGESGITNGTGAEARFNSPLGLAIDATGNLYVADSGNHLVRKITSAGDATTLAGTAEFWGGADGAGTNAQFNCPAGVAVDTNGNVFVSDSANHTIRKITPDGSVTTLAGLAGSDGSTDEAGSAARFSKPAELVIDRYGNVFVADSFTHTIRKVTPDGTVTTIAGSPNQDGATDGSGESARFFNPYGLAVDRNANLRVADTYNQTIRLIHAPIQVAVTMTNGGVLLRWNSNPGSRYQAQSASTLNGDDWQDLGAPIIAASETVTHFDAAPARQRYYRVELLP